MIHFPGHAKTVDILIEFGATVDDLDNNGWTPLLCGAYMGIFGNLKFNLAKVSFHANGKTNFDIDLNIE